ncbi:centrosomal protein POC5-like [Tubulanus polymorphus]|uniref:centrosomal protein POC5-like n=1 Tax=Tubulanus polymorphus TaxID=672921 RepID=UPI003DA3E36D
MSDESNNNESSSIPMLPPDSPGSSVSSQFLDEYEEVIKYAVVVPSYDPKQYAMKLTDSRGTFSAPGNNDNNEQPIASTSTPAPSSERHMIIEREPQSSTAESTVGSDDSNNDIQKKRKEKTIKKVSYQETRMTAADVSRIRASLPADILEIEEEKIVAEVDNQEQTEEEEEGEEDGEEVDNPRLLLDEDLTRMESVLDQWTFDLKRNVLAELSQLKIRITQNAKKTIEEEKEKCRVVTRQLQSEMDGLRDLISTYEQSIKRKDTVISNLTTAMQKQQDKYQTLRAFCEWKIKLNDQKREEFALNMARKHHRTALQRKVWESWHSVIEAKWRDRVEKACQSKASEVCMDLSNDYEARIRSLEEALADSRTEVTKLHKQRDEYEETMKKAFMRGVCALNMEAMTMFNEAGEKQGSDSSSVNQQPTPPTSSQQQQQQSCYHSNENMPPVRPVESYKYQQEPIYHTAAPPRVITSQASKTKVSSMSKSLQTRPVANTRTISAKITGRADATKSNKPSPLGSNNVQLAPPMSSVIVERHQPIVKQTIGQATAAKYPVNSATGGGNAQQGISHRKIAGQTGPIKISNPGSQTINVE